MEWTTPMLAADAGVSARSISGWRNGSRRPRRGEWSLVAAVLALKPCSHCGGSGTVDPTENSIARITQAVQSSGVALPDPEPLITGDGWTLDANTLTLTVSGTPTHLTRQEARLIAVLALGLGRCIQSDRLAEAMRARSYHTVHVYLSRLRRKFAAAGLPFDRVVQFIPGAGYRAVMAARTEATA